MIQPAYESVNFDFLSLFDESSVHRSWILEILKEYDDVVEELTLGKMKIFTEYIYKRNIMGTKSEKRIILVSKFGFYYLNKDLWVKLRIPLDKIKSMTIIRASPNLIAVRYNDNQGKEMD